ncbi:hypothetical protein D3C76_1015610 [compost metagenome]
MLDDVADHAFGFSPEDVQRVGFIGLVGLCLQRQQADLRAIAVRDDQFVARMDLGDLLGGDADIGALIVRSHGFATAQQGVTAQCNNDTHDDVLLALEAKLVWELALPAMQAPRSSGYCADAIAGKAGSHRSEGVLPEWITGRRGSKPGLP